MNILALDTSTEVMGICLQSSDGRVTSLSASFGLQHSARLLPCIRHLLEQCGLVVRELGLIVCSLGPGSFTGLRIGLSTAKGLAAGIDCPLVGVPTLEALAHGCRFFPGVVVPVIDARKKRIYTAFFQEGKRLSADLDLTPAELTEKLAAYPQVLLTGPMAGQLHPALPAAQLDPHYPLCRAHSLLLLGLEKFQRAGGAGETLAPVYLRKSEAEIKFFEQR